MFYVIQQNIKNSNYKKLLELEQCIQKLMKKLSSHTATITLLKIIIIINNYNESLLRFFLLKYYTVET